MSDQLSDDVPTDVEDTADDGLWNLYPPPLLPELYQGYGEDHAEYLGENPFADTIEEGLL